ncbi:hypothetical protein K449DRAFT_140071 [Hypoxylon sp. EC38]|nr:hypothetical protein K449DRAFT_140071 [Hypoxylon sp. EC38]
MAIIPEFPGAEVTVQIRGNVATEHDDSNTKERQQKQNKNVGTKICCKYIQCKDDAPFSIHLKVTNQYTWGHRNHSLNIAVYLDGKWVRGEFCREWNTHLGDWERDVDHRITMNEGGQFVEQGFKFTGITKIEEADMAQFKQDLRKLERMGTIEVRFYRVIELKDDDDGFQPQKTSPADFELAEKALKGKAISHGAGFSAPMRAPKAPRYVDSQNLPEDNGPIAIFRFLYRSQESLIQEGIISRPPSKGDKKSATPAALSGLTQEEIETLAMERLQQKRLSWFSEAESRLTGSLERKRKKEEDENIKDIKDVKDVKDIKEVKKEGKGPVKHEISQTIDLTAPPRPYKKAKKADGKVIIDLDDE